MVSLLLSLFLVLDQGPEPPQVIYFHASWCKYCPQQDKIMKDLPVSVYTVDIDANKPLAAKYNVKSVPYVIILNKNSWDPKVRFPGVTSRAVILKAVP